MKRATFFGWFLLFYTIVESQKSPHRAHRCGDNQKLMDECFKDLPPCLMDFLENINTDISAKEIKVKCNVFNRAVKCFDAYSARCLQNERPIVLKNNLYVARKFFKKFCSDVDLQQDYLRHKQCFTYIKSDWINCTFEFDSVRTFDLQNGKINISDKYKNFCCARYEYKDCIYKSARNKCYKNSTENACETAKIFSDEKLFPKCREFKDTCSHAGRVVFIWSSIIPIALILVSRFRCHRIGQ